MQKLRKIFQFVWKQPRWRLAVAALLIIAAALLFFSRGGAGPGKSLTFAARRGPLEINVLEGGSLQALEFQEAKCEVRVGYQGTKILKIVDEGYMVTEDDVKNGKVLVELDSSELQKQIVQQEIQYQSAVASLIDAQQNYEIQLNQNQSDIKAAEQKVRFARMDFDKFLGDNVTERIVKEVGLDKLLAVATTNDVQHTARAEAASAEKAAPFEQKEPVAAAPGFTGNGRGGNGQAIEMSQPKSPVIKAGSVVVQSDGKPGARPGAQMVMSSGSTNLPPGVKLPPAGRPQPAATSPTPAMAGNDDDEPDASELGNTNRIVVDFSRYAKIEVLGDGEAKQKVRKFDDDLQVAQKELGQAKSTLEGTQRLFEKGFVTRIDLQRDEIANENSRLKVQTAESARDLFLKYDFLKSAEQALSAYAEAVRELDKARRVAISKAAQAKARLKSAQGQHTVQLRQRNDLNEQQEKCTIRAQKSGLVVYGGARDDMFYYGGEERIREGASVRERQAIITIPDLSRMSVNVKIHESYIKKIKKAQKARITVDAFPDKPLTGEVTKVGVLPDSQNRWMNPDMKVYLTTITVDGSQDWVKPGMSAKVEILVNRLEDCIYVPLQAVCPEDDRQFCYLSSGVKSERREVVIGDFNDEFIEIKSGLKEGDRVLLRPPEAADSEAHPRNDKKGKGKEPETPKGTQPANPAGIAQAHKT